MYIMSHKYWHMYLYIKISLYILTFVHMYLIAEQFLPLEATAIERERRIQLCVML